MSKYFDYAAATPLDEHVLETMQPYFSEKFHNPNGVSMDSMAVSDALENARAAIAKDLGVQPHAVTFTSGATESNNLIALQAKNGTMLYSAIEHSSVIAAAKGWANKSIDIAVNQRGIIELEQLKESLTDDVTVVSISLVNHEIGTIQPMRDIVKVIESTRASRAQRDINSPLLFHADASQAPLFMKLKMNSLGVDAISLNGGKIYGPKGSGVLVSTQKLAYPLFFGGDQEFGRRAGTPHIANCIGFSKAFHLAQVDADAERKRLEKLQLRLITEIQKNNLKLNSIAKNSSPSIVNWSFDDIDGERLVMELDELGCVVATGSACDVNNEDPSHVLVAVGLSKTEANSSVRVSFGRETTLDDVEYLIESLHKLGYFTV